MKNKKLFKKLGLAIIGLAVLLSILGITSCSNVTGQDNSKTAQEEWLNFENQYPAEGWKVEWNEKDKAPKKILGGSIKASKFGIDTVTEDNIETLAKSFIRSNKSLLKIDYSDLKKIKVHGRRRLKVISYRQMHSDIPVFNSVVTITVKNDRIVMFKAKHYKDISVSIKPSISGEKAANIAGRLFKAKDRGIKSKDQDLVIYPLKKGGYALTYKVDFPVMKNPSAEEEKEKPHIQPTVFVDAHTGEIIDIIDNIVYEDLSGTVTGMIYPDFTDEPQVEAAFRHAWVYADTSQGTSGENGTYLISGLSGAVNVNARLEGPWATVSNMQQDEASHSADISVPGIHNWNWADDDISYKQEESNAFYHTNIIHDYVTKPSLGVYEMDLLMAVNVNYDSTCNAFASTESINFYSASDSCESTALDAGVIYHEYGHRINRHLVPVYWPYSDQTGNMNEGIADYWGCTITNDPCHGKYRYGVCGRRADSLKRYPDNYYSEPHSGAEIISGAFWDTRTVLGADYVDGLVVDALRQGPMSFSELCEYVLIADDDNGDLNDGTPNIDTISHSFWDLHGIFTEYSADHTQTGIAEITSPAPRDTNIYKDGVIIIKGTAHGTASSPLDNYTLEYASQDNPEDWSSDGITAAGGDILNGVLGEWDISGLSEGLYNLRVRITYGGTQSSSYPVTIGIDKHLRDGWPINTSHWIGTSPSIEDLDGNGSDDIIMGSWSKLYALNSDGTLLTGWSSKGMCTSVVKSAIGDIDGDGDKEAVFADICGYVKAYHHDGTLYWEYELDSDPDSDDILGSPTLADLNNDGRLETIFGSDDGNLYVLDYQGGLLWSNSTIGKIRSSPAVGDLNNDGHKEIIATSFNYTTEEFLIYIYTSNGAYFTDSVTVELAEPYTYDYFTRYESSPALADLDNDGNLDIVLGLSDGSVGAWDRNGNLLWRYHDASLSSGVYKMMRSPAIGDIDNDGDLEIVINNWVKTYAFHHTGDLVNNWPVSYSSSSSSSSPVLYDLDADGDLEIIVPGYKKVHIYEHTGTEIYTDSFRTQGLSRGTAAVGDLDNNGKPDIVFGSNDEYLYAWEVDTQGDTAKAQWNSLHGENYNSGNYNYLTVKEDTTSPVVSVAYPENPGEIVPPEGFDFTGTAEDEGSGIDKVILSVYDYAVNAYTVENEEAGYDPVSKVWSFQVLPDHITPEYDALLTVYAIDRAGNMSGVWENQVIVDEDTLGPVVSITYPGPGSLGRYVPASGFDFTGTAEDEASPIETVIVYVYDYGRSESTVYYEEAAYDPVSKIWSYQVLPEHISAGYEAFLNVYATDTFGNMSPWYQKFPIVVEDTTGPEISITYPGYSDSIVPGSGFEFTGTTEDDFTGIKTVKVYVYDYGRSAGTVIYEEAGYDPLYKVWSFQVLPEHLSPGYQARLTVYSKDWAGNYSLWRQIKVTVE